MTGPLAARGLLWRAQFWSFLKRHRRAIDDYRALLALEPQRVDAWRCIGFLYAQEKAPARAIEALAEAVRLAPDDADTRFNLGFLYHERGDLDRAVIEFREAIRLKPMQRQASTRFGSRASNAR